jgi:hypothetical protein
MESNKPSFFIRSKVNPAPHPAALFAFFLQLNKPVSYLIHSPLSLKRLVNAFSNECPLITMLLMKTDDHAILGVREVCPGGMHLP